VEKRARDGRRVTLTRIVKQDGQVVRTEVVSRDSYRAFPGVVRLGTASSPRSERTARTRGEAAAAPEPAPARPEGAAPTAPEG
jgi:hypothetical protein